MDLFPLFSSNEHVVNVSIGARYFLNFRPAHYKQKEKKKDKFEKMTSS